MHLPNRPPITYCALFAIVFHVTACPTTVVATEPNEDPRLTEVKRLEALVDFLQSEWEIATNLEKQQAASQAEVDAVHAELVLAKHDLALVKDDLPERKAQCQSLIEIRGRQLKREVEVSRLGFGSKLKLSVARRRLAFSYHLRALLDEDASDALRQLQRIVRFGNDEVVQFEKLQSDGAVSTVALNRARYRLTLAEHLLASAQGDSQSILPKLRESVEHCQSEMDQINRLRQQGYADITDQYFARIHFLNARLLLANLEEDESGIEKQLDQLIQTHEQTLPKLGDQRKGKIARLIIERELERDRERKTQYQRDGQLADDLSFAAIGT